MQVPDPYPVLKVREFVREVQYQDVFVDRLSVRFVN